jgi:hypothetical protein
VRRRTQLSHAAKAFNITETLEVAMKFMMTFQGMPSTRERESGVARFQTMGAQVPKGARLLGRWMRADASGGFDLLETEDPSALEEFAELWGRLIQLKLEPLSARGIAAALADLALVE